MRLKLGTFASSGVSFFNGIVNWLIGADSGKMFASTDGNQYRSVRQTIFGTSNVNDVFYGTDLSIQSPPTWTTQTSNFGTSNVFSIAYGNGLWIAGGQAGTLRTSTNAVAWTTVTSNFGNSTISFVKNTNNIWFAGGDASQLRQSTDGLTWTTISTSPLPTDSNSAIRDIIFINNTWIISAIDFSSGPPIVKVRSTPSLSSSPTWTTVSSNYENFTSGQAKFEQNNNIVLLYGNAGEMRTSTNGSTWTTVTSNFSTSNISSIAYGNSLWVAGGDSGQIRTSTNGSTWTTVTSNFGNTVINSIAYGNGLWVAGGDIGQIRTSNDAITWVTQNSNFGNTHIYSIAYANSLWVAGGLNGQIRTSPQLYTYPNKAFLAAANDGKLGYSTNGLTWTTRNIEGTNNYSSIAYGNGLYYAGGT